ncbi:MAG: DUF308 domain-containing protein [Candidatus Methanomethylophilaceae archaeon]|jgi:uncharacterized membrane protein HdeD (DUF308 family)|nr:DUF308 domain-containing protein [Candidatus Methanomethylophilaceae archaeon]NLF34077.1 hypothetical protein [Thermoplasmatales archaeon]
MDNPNVTIGNPWGTMLLLGVLYIALGAMALIWPNTTLDVLIIFLGATALVGGLSSLYYSHRDSNGMGMVAAVAMAVLGVIAMALPQFVGDVLVYLLAAFFAVFGVLQIIGSASFSGVSAAGRWLSVIVGVLFVVAAVIMLFFTGVEDSKAVIMIVFGAFSVMNGALLVADGLHTRKACP